jgi:hypothetical protein
VAGIDCPAQGSPAECRERLGEKDIQALARLIGRYRKPLRPGWRMRRQKSSLGAKDYELLLRRLIRFGIRIIGLRIA